MSEPAMTITIGQLLKMCISGIGTVKEMYVVKVYDDKVYLCDEIPEMSKDDVDFPGWFHYLPKKVSQYIRLTRNSTKPLSTVIKELKTE